jgi:hypothetical protein
MRRIAALDPPMRRREATHGRANSNTSPAPYPLPNGLRRVGPLSSVENFCRCENTPYHECNRADDLQPECTPANRKGPETALRSNNRHEGVGTRQTAPKVRAHYREGIVQTTNEPKARTRRGEAAKAVAGMKIPR